MHENLENWSLEFWNLGQNDQNAPDNKTMALKPGFSEINFAKMGNVKWKWYKINPNMILYAYSHDKNP